MVRKQPIPPFPSQPVTVSFTKSLMLDSVVELD